MTASQLYRRALRGSKLLRRVVTWAGRTHWPGFERVNLYDVLVFVVKESSRNDITFRSYAIAFTFFISLFPGVLVLFTLIPYLPIYEAIEVGVAEYLQQLLPGASADTAIAFIADIGTRPRSGLLSLSFLLAFYFSSNGMMAMMRSFEKNYPQTYRKRRSVKKRFVAIGLTLAFGGLLVVSVLLITLGTAFLDAAYGFTHLSAGYEKSLRALQWLAITSFLYSAVAVTYRYGTATVQRMRFFSPGAVLATSLNILTSLAFALYINNFDSYNKLYGSIGTIIIFMIWLQLNIFWILLGYELNAAIVVNRDLRAGSPDQDADEEFGFA